MKIHLEFLTPSMHNAGGWKGKPGEQPTAYSAPDVQQSRVAYYIAEVQLPECLREVTGTCPDYGEVAGWSYNTNSKSEALWQARYNMVSVYDVDLSKKTITFSVELAPFYQNDDGAFPDTIYVSGKIVDIEEIYDHGMKNFPRSKYLKWNPMSLT